MISNFFGCCLNIYKFKGGGVARVTSLLFSLNFFFPFENEL